MRLGSKDKLCMHGSWLQDTAAPEPLHACIHGHACRVTEGSLRWGRRGQMWRRWLRTRCSAPGARCARRPGTGCRWAPGWRCTTCCTWWRRTAQAHTLPVSHTTTAPMHTIHASRADFQCHTAVSFHGQRWAHNVQLPNPGCHGGQFGRVVRLTVCRHQIVGILTDHSLVLCLEFLYVDSAYVQWFVYSKSGSKEGASRRCPCRRKG